LACPPRADLAFQGWEMERSMVGSGAPDQPAGCVALRQRRFGQRREASMREAPIR
jgi:hypothetical protein